MVNTLQQTDSLVTYTQYLCDKISANMNPLGIQSVFYGDQAKIPNTPTVCLETDTKSRAIDGTSRRTLNTLTAYVIIYHSKVQDIQVTRKEVDLLAEAIESLIHEDPRLGGLVIHSLVTTIQSAYATKTGSVYRAARLTVQAISQSLLPNNIP